MLGHDTGAKRDKISTLEAGITTVMIPNQRGDWYTPSVVHKSLDGSCVIGEEACQRGYIDPDGLAENFKPHLGTSDNLLRGGRVMTAAQALELLVRAQKENAEKVTGTAQQYVVCLCPPHFRDDQKADQLSAYERCGLKVLQITLEPVAAAYAFAIHRTGKACMIHVVDAGHFTTDSCVAVVEGNTVKVLAADGLCVGGRDFDAVITKHVLDHIERDHGSLPDTKSDALFYLDLARQIEQAKISLSGRREVLIPVTYRGRHTVVTVSQADYQREIEPLVQQIKDLSDRVIASAGLTYSGVDHYLPIGGMMRMSLLADPLAKHIGMRPRTDVDPDKASVYGAAVLCGELMREQGLHTAMGTRVLPTTRVMLRNVTAHAVGCTVLDRASRRLTLSAMVGKNSPIPCERIEEFFLEHDDQTEAIVEILQGVADADRDSCLVIGTLHLTGLPKEPVRTRRIRVECRIDANGMVSVTVMDTVGCQSQTASIGCCKHGVAGTPSQPMI